MNRTDKHSSSKRKGISLILALLALVALVGGFILFNPFGKQTSSDKKDTSSSSNASSKEVKEVKYEPSQEEKEYLANRFAQLTSVNPEAIAEQLEAAKAQVAAAKAAGKEILVVCEKKMYATELEALAKKSGVSFLNYKVSGGFLTNFATYKKRIDSINEMAEFMQSDAYAALTKKEQLVYKRNFDRANKVYKGVTNLKKRPDLVVIVDGAMLSTLIDEVENLKGKLDSIIIAGTNFSRYWAEEQMVVTNINSYTSLDFVLNYLLS